MFFFLIPSIMTLEKEYSRVFLGAKVIAPWPEDLPGGKIIQENYRHITLVFLGEIEKKVVESTLRQFPLPKFSIGLTGQFTKVLFLPPKHSHVVAYEAKFYEEKPFLFYQKQVMGWLKVENIKVKNSSRQFYPHVTIARGNFEKQEWEKAFQKLPFYMDSINLYESLGNSNYEVLHTHSPFAPFEEIQHTADIAFIVRGHTIQDLHRAAETALAFKSPGLVNYFKEEITCHSIDEVIADLNEHVAHADSEIGCSFKAVSFHGDLQENKQGILEWEMIIDV